MMLDRSGELYTGGVAVSTTEQLKAGKVTSISIISGKTHMARTQKPKIQQRQLWRAYDNGQNKLTQEHNSECKRDQHDCMVVGTVFGYCDCLTGEMQTGKGGYRCMDNVVQGKRHFDWGNQRENSRWKALSGTARTTQRPSLKMLALTEFFVVTCKRGLDPLASTQAQPRSLKPTTLRT